MIRTGLLCCLALALQVTCLTLPVRAQSSPSLLSPNGKFLERLPPVSPDDRLASAAPTNGQVIPSWLGVNPASPNAAKDAALVHYQESAADEATPQGVNPVPGMTDTSGIKKKDDKKKEEFPNFKLTGFTQLDGGWYSQSPNNMTTVGDAQDGVGFRRARLAAYGKAAEMTNWQIEMDFATAGRPSFFDVFLEQMEVPALGNVRIGQFVQPFSIDSMSGFRNLPFLERSLPFLAFVPFRRVGLMAYDLSLDEMTNWAVSVFKTGGYNNAPLGDDRFATDIGDIGGYSFTTRLSHLLYYDPHAEDRYLWLVGGGYDFSQMTQNDAAGSGAPGNAGGGPSPFFQSRVLPEFGSLGYPENSSPFGNAANGTPIFIDSGRYAAESFNLWGLETMWQTGPWSAQSEWMAMMVNSAVGPIFYNGAYFEVMYRLTGETRVYDKKTASLKNPVPYTDFISAKPGGIWGWGAWEIAGRWSFVNIHNPDDLNGHYYNAVTNTYTANGGNGNGTLNDLTLGVTWFLNQHAKLQFNMIHAMLDNVVTGNSTANLFVTRAQVDW
jgi:phosphate-selective porin OprO/OprP